MRVTKFYCDVCGDQIEMIDEDFSKMSSKALRYYKDGEIVAKGFEMCPKCRQEADDIELNGYTLWLLGKKGEI